ncbi:MAG: tetratricopeptide repeat protein [Chloroflexi bacterium]|nr:tetratricopeptide repeat protein [Chloroflexota bacterium]
MAEDIQAILKEAEGYFNDREWEQAVMAYERVMKADPNNGDACAKIAEIYAIRGQISKVVEQYFRLMEILTEKGDTKIVVEVAEWINKLQPENLKPKEKILALYEKKGEIDKEVELSLKLARLYIERGEADEKPIDLLKKVLERDPENLNIALELAEIYLSSGHIQEGLMQFRTVSDAFIEKGMLDKAADAMKRMKVLQPDDQDLMFRLGNLYIELGKLDEAEAEYRAILRLNLNHIDALMALGNVCQKKGQYKDATLAFNKILSINPQEVSAREKLGELNHAQGLAGEAIKHYLSAAHSYQVSGNTENAVRIFQKVLSLDPTNPTATRELTNIGAPLRPDAGDEFGDIIPVIPTAEKEDLDKPVKLDKKAKDRKVKDSGADKAEEEKIEKEPAEAEELEKKK